MRSTSHFRRVTLGLPRFLLLTGVLVLLTACGGGLDGSDPNERAISASSLGVNRADENIPVLLEAIENEPEVVQNAAIESLGRIGTVKAVDALSKYRDSEARLIRIGIAQALGSVLPEAYSAAADSLLEMSKDAMPRAVGDDPNLPVRRAIVTALSITQQPQAVPFLLDRLANEYDENIRNAAVMTIGRIGEKHDLREVLGDKQFAIDTLTHVYRTDNEKNKAWAIESLGKLGDPRAVPIIMEAFDDYDAVTRGKAAWALMTMKGDEAKPVLRERLETETADMPAVVMAHCLALLGETEDTLPFLEDRVLHASNNFARAEAARVLRQVGRRESMIPLDKAFETDRDGLVRKEAAESMRALIVRFPREELPGNEVSDSDNEDAGNP